MYSTIMVVIFVLGYLCIALEHPLKIDKAASALLIGVLTWAVFILFGGTDSHLVGEALNENLAETAQTLFFLFAAMTIVEIVDRHNGFKIITDRITATSKVKLLWILSFLTFFMSAVLDNLTTTIVILSLLRKLIKDQHTRWTYASIVVIAANAGGAWSPIGDVTTIMLWIGGQITAAKIITGIIIPSLVSMIVPLIILSFTLKGEIERPEASEESESITTPGEQLALLILGVGLLLFVPVFKTITHLPPYMGMLLGLGVMWMVTELMHKKKSFEIKKKLTVVHILKHVETPTIFFFLGILTAVGALGAAGQLGQLSEWLRDVTGGNIYVIDTVIGVLSSIIDNVPLVAASMGMYNFSPETVASITEQLTPFIQDGTIPSLFVEPIQHGIFSSEILSYIPEGVISAEFIPFFQNGLFWHMLAYCAGTGGSILIIGSAAGVAAMGLEKIDFIWYLKHISWLALVGYLAGAFCIYLGL